MRRLLILLLLLIGAHGHAVGIVEGGVPDRAIDAAALVGAWTGEWTAETDSRARPLELIVTRRGTGDSDVVIAQFTFLTGAHAWTARREGIVVDGAVRFKLPAGGTILVRMVDSERLIGEFTGAHGALPAERGSFELSRAR